MTAMANNETTDSRDYCGAVTEDPYFFLLMGIKNKLHLRFPNTSRKTFFLFCMTQLTPTLNCMVRRQIVFCISGSPVQCFSHSLLAIKSSERKLEMKS